MTLDEPARKKKKKRPRTASSEPRPTAAEPEDAAPEERNGDDAQQRDVDLAAAPPTTAGPMVEAPKFTRSFPRDAALDALVSAFERGDYAFVRAEAPALARRTEDPEVRRAALELRRRIDPDKLSLLLVGFAFALLVVLAIFYWTNKHS